MVEHDPVHWVDQTPETDVAVFDPGNPNMTGLAPRLGTMAGKLSVGGHDLAGQRFHEPGEWQLAHPGAHGAIDLQGGFTGQMRACGTDLGRLPHPDLARQNCFPQQRMPMPQI